VNLRSLALLGVSLFGAGGQDAAPRDGGGAIDLQALTLETQRSARRFHAFDLVWWMPYEWWQTELAQNETVSPQAREQFLSLLRPYSIVIVADAKLRIKGASKSIQVDAVSEPALRGALSLKAPSGTVYHPLAAEEIDPRIQRFFDVMKPIVAQGFGELGKSMCFFAFKAKSAGDAPIVDATSNGKFSFLVGEREYTWHLPLATLVPPKTCSKCRENVSGAFSFCPWDGQKLDADEKK
jgi:hypothetical protein